MILALNLGIKVQERIGHPQLEVPATKHMPSVSITWFMCGQVGCEHAALLI